MTVGREVAPRAPAQLEAYRKKRDPARTPEPFGEHAAPAPRLPRVLAPLGGPRFVVQKHWARALHYDFRLELDHVLKSWSVPKGPSVHVEEKRLAVHVEDHPLEYADFEGVIPSGNYGAGSVIVWDRGWFGTFKDEDLLAQYARGKLELELHGLKLRGRWTLVRMGGKEREWLLLKKADGAAGEIEAVEQYPESVISGLTVEEMRDAPGTLAALRERLGSLEAPEHAVSLGQASLMLATLAEHPPSGAGWCFEIKYDGVRVLAFRDGEEVRMAGRSGEDITARYPEVAAALRGLAVPRFLLDGEIIAEDERGRPSFQHLQARMGLSKPRDIESARARVPVRGVFFDCLSAEGHDLRKLPLEHRKEILARVVPPLGPAQRCDHVLEHGEAFLEVVTEMGLEGIVAKRLASAYVGRRSPDWIKVKSERQQEFVIGGYTDPQGSRAGFGALHVGLYDGTKLVYVTKVGTGFDAKEIRRLRQELDPLARETSPFDERTPTGRGHHWVEPRLVCEVRFAEWTRDGGLRAPVYLGQRFDIRPEDCKREQPIDVEPQLEGGDTSPPQTSAEEPSAASATKPGPKGSRTRARRAAVPRSRSATAPSVAADAKDRVPPPAPEPPPAPHEPVRLTNLKKVFWPEGYTKGDLIDYYVTVAPHLLPYLRDRPVVLTRYPDGIDGKSFFQKDAPVYVPDWIRTETIHSDDAGRDIRYFVIDDEESLRYVANLGTIPLHVWPSRAGSLDHPDWMVIDLDPKGAPFSHVVQVARALKTILDELGLPGYPKTSGATGLHVLIPMGQRYSDEDTRTFARVLATLTVEAVPEISTITRAIRGRGGKVYVDFGQNGAGNTIVGPYSLRPLPGAPASCPLRWDEVNARLDPAKFTMKTLPKRFEHMPDPLLPVLGPGVDMGAAIAAIERRMADAPAGKKDRT